MSFFGNQCFLFANLSVWRQYGWNCVYRALLPVGPVPLCHQACPLLVHYHRCCDPPEVSPMKSLYLKSLEIIVVVTIIKIVKCGWERWFSG